MATIKPIEGRSVHQIQSGQVIVDLISVCKELIENSVDAGATSIEVRFKNNGLDAIEVQDNGSGISPEDYDTIALKHYTSKLSTYDDLSSLQTFGFRGEALSSLCALSKFYIITARASDGPKGTKLEFEQSGKLKATSVVAAKQGTTVVVETLFHNLPVRRKELEKNIKRQYSKVLEMLNAYACISTGVKIVVSNQILKGKKTVAFATNGNANTKENIANVYGAKALSSLIPLSLHFEMDTSSRPGSTQSARNWSTQEDGRSHKVEIVGHISRPVAGEGRQLPDRQMFFVNSRPCDLPQVRKAFTEVYKTYNLSQSPFVFANIKLDTNAYDVNVSPDKRSIMLHDQAALLESLKDALTELFEGHDQSVPQAQLLDKRTPSASAFKPPTMQPRASTMSVSAESNEPALPSLPRSSSTHSEPSESLQSEVTPRPGFVKASLIERFAERDLEERPDHLLTKRKRPGSEQNENSEAKVIAPTSLSHIASSEASDGTRREHGQREQSPLFEPENDSPIEVATDAKESGSVEVNSERSGSQHVRPVARLSQAPEDPDNMEEEDEERIPAVVQTPQRFTQSSLQNAFDRMRPLRTPVQQATITIGDTTTTSTIGSGSESRAAKRARIHTPKFSLSGAPLSQTPKRSSIMKSLRGFSAPGTQMEESDDGDEQDKAERSLPIAHGFASSPQKRIPVRGLEPSTADDDDAFSSSLPEAGLAPADEEGEGPEAPGPIPEAEDNESDEEYVDESEKRAREEAKIAQMIEETEAAAARPTEENLKRATKLFRTSMKKYSTTNLESTMRTTSHAIGEQVTKLDRCHLDSDLKMLAQRDTVPDRPSSTQLNNEDPEERLSLTVTKSDFSDMRIIGQFNLGFILAVRPPTARSPSSDLFIIDQHASDEKYNFERLSASTILVSQRLVHPHPLELTAVEEEIILANNPSLTANGFTVDLDTSGATQTGHRARLTSLPMSKEVTFTPTDLEELLALIMDSPPSSSLSTSPHIPRPSKIRKLLASRACRGSVMIGKTLKQGKMEEIVRHMGSMDKPWSCPHGRPTMRHLFGLEKWDGWVEGSGVKGLGEEAEKVDWGAYLKGMRK